MTRRTEQSTPTSSRRQLGRPVVHCQALPRPLCPTGNDDQPTIGGYGDASIAGFRPEATSGSRHTPYRRHLTAGSFASAPPAFAPIATAPIWVSRVRRCVGSPAGVAVHQLSEAKVNQFSHHQRGVGMSNTANIQDRASNAVEIIGVAGDDLDQKVCTPAKP